MTALTQPVLAAGRWRHVPAATSATFAVRNLGCRTVHGAVPVADAWVDVDDSGVARQARAVLDLRAIDTGNAKRDRDLRKPHLLGTDERPTLQFSGTPQPGPEGWTVAGTLAGRCTTEVSLAAVIDSASPDEVAVTATGEFDRRELGVRAPRLLIGRRVRVTVRATFRAP